MKRNRSWMAGAAKADSRWEGMLRDTIFKDWVHQAEKVPYVIEHNYTPDFELSNILIESKGRFREPAEAAKYKHIRTSLEGSGRELIFVFYNPSTPMPFARKRKDGTKQSHAEWAEKNDFRWYTVETVKELFKEIEVEYPQTLLEQAEAAKKEEASLRRKKTTKK